MAEAINKPVVTPDEKKKADQINKDFDDKTPPSHNDSPLESIGKAVTEPMRDAADEDGDERPKP